MIHITVFGIFTALGLLLFPLTRTGEELEVTALGIAIVTALFAVPVYLTTKSPETTGEPNTD